MSKPSVYSCPSCNATNPSVLDDATLIACRNCYAIVFENAAGYGKPVPARTPDDWSIMKIGSEIEYNNHRITVVGRLRLQLRNDYKNFWCAALNDGKHIWVMESFASYCILGAAWHVFENEIGHLLAGANVALNKQLKLKGEYTEICEGISYEGEIGHWKFFSSGFHFIQCSNKNNNTAVFFADRDDNIQYLSGGKIDHERLNLKNIQAWDEWE